MNKEKCFCDLYLECTENAERRVSVGHNAIEDKEVFLTGTEFVDSADELCPGTHTYVSSKVVLRASNVVLDGETVTMPREAITRECEYFQAIYRGM